MIKTSLNISSVVEHQISVNRKGKRVKRSYYSTTQLKVSLLPNLITIFQPSNFDHHKTKLVVCYLPPDLCGESYLLSFCCTVLR